MSTIVLSIIIPVYNTEKYLRDCLDSILTQGANPYDYEVICVNDMSTDNSPQILLEYSKKYSNMIFVTNEKEIHGASVARNIGIDLAKGEYLWFVDSDDTIGNGCFCDLITELKNGNEDLYSLGHTNVDENFNYKSMQSKLEKSKLLQFVCATWENIAKKSFLINTKNLCKFNETVKYGEDIIFWSYAYSSYDSYSKNLGKIYNYRKVNNSVSNNTKKREDYDRCLHDNIELIKAHEECLDIVKNDDIKGEMTFYRSNHIRHIITELMHFSSLNRFKIINDFYKKGYITKKQYVKAFFRSLVPKFVYRLKAKI